jgi:hypothetical protein
MLLCNLSPEAGVPHPVHPVWMDSPPGMLSWRCAVRSPILAIHPLGCSSTCVFVCVRANALTDTNLQLCHLHCHSIHKNRFQLLYMPQKYIYIYIKKRSHFISGAYYIGPILLNSFHDWHWWQLFCSKLCHLKDKTVTKFSVSTMC